MRTYIKIVRYVFPYWSKILLNILFNIIYVLFSLVSLTMVIPFLELLFDRGALITVKPEFAWTADAVKDYFYYFISDIIMVHGKVDALFFICILVVVMFFMKNLFRYLAMYVISPVRNRVVRDIRNDLYQKVLILPLSFYTEQRKGDIISRMSTDVIEIEWSILNSIELIFREPISIIAFVITLFIMSPQLTLFVLVFLPITALIIGRIGRSLKKKSATLQTRLGEMTSMVEETISGLRIIKAFNAIDYTARKFSVHNHKLTRLMTSIYRKRDLASPLSEFLGALVLVIVMWFGGRLVLGSDQSVSAEVFIAYIVVFSQLFRPVQAITTAYYYIQKGIASANRVKEILDAEEVIVEKQDAISKKEFENSIEYKNVSFSYEKETVLNNVSVTIPKGRTIALVGPSGGGKSTFVDLLPRFYDTVGGDILIDGIPIRDLVISDLRGMMGIVTQESILFNDSVFNNIAFGKPGVSLEKVMEAARIANAHDFIMEMEQGYQTNIGDRGSKLSGGQRQRISIARAVLKNPPILILDEATSALDTESERIVQEALFKLMENRTSIIIAHRLSTIQFVDEILVIHRGEIVERGNHNTLVSQNGVYKKLVEMQAF